MIYNNASSNEIISCVIGYVVISLTIYFITPFFPDTYKKINSQIDLGALAVFWGPLLVLSVVCICAFIAFLPAMGLYNLKEYILKYSIEKKEKQRVLNLEKDRKLKELEERSIMLVEKIEAREVDYRTANCKECGKELK